MNPYRADHVEHGSNAAHKVLDSIAAVQLACGLVVLSDGMLQLVEEGIKSIGWFLSPGVDSRVSVDKLNGA
jgi:hypothetical protein